MSEQQAKYGNPKALKCVRCSKDIIGNEGFFNYPSGVRCVKCGDRKSLDTVGALKFTLKIAKLQLGCAPSAGYMEELILEARRVLDITTKER